jgi:hypothetical protein
MSMMLDVASAQMMYPTAPMAQAAMRNHRRPKRSELAAKRRMVTVATVVMQGTTQAESSDWPNWPRSWEEMAAVVGVALTCCQYFPLFLV